MPSISKPRPTAPQGKCEIVEQASRWFVRLQAEADDATVHEWKQWYQADPEHAAAWQGFAALHEALPDGRRSQDSAQAAAVKAVANRQGRREHLKLILSTLAIGLTASGTYRYANNNGWMADYRTRVGEQRAVRIGAAATPLLLNTNTAIDIKPNGRFTDVHLYSGELWLNDTRQHAAADIRVLTHDAVIEPSSAQLLVRCLRDEASPYTFAALRKGYASITTSRQVKGEMHADQMLRITGDRMFVQSGLPDREFAWTNGVLVADGMRLGEFLAELARYRPGLLSCAPELENLPITGTFRIQNTDLVLEALAASENLKLDYRTRYWVKVLPA